MVEEVACDGTGEGVTREGAAEGLGVGWVLWQAPVESAITTAATHPIALMNS